jgi:hypothetical protein
VVDYAKYIFAEFEIIGSIFDVIISSFVEFVDQQYVLDWTAEYLGIFTILLDITIMK